jgi:hypothetical protein
MLSLPYRKVVAMISMKVVLIRFRLSTKVVLMQAYLWNRSAPEPTSLIAHREPEAASLLAGRRGELARCAMPQSKATCSHCGARPCQKPKLIVP